MRSRDTEKTIRELQQFLREHEDEITDEDSMHRLAITFMSQHNSRAAAETDRAGRRIRLSGAGGGGEL